MKEVTIEKYLKSEVERRGGMCVKFPPLFFAGFPDRIVLLPGELIVFVELKAPGEKPSALQSRVHAKLQRLGFLVWVADSKERVDLLVEMLTLI